jgi:hypothetical protein
MSAIAGDAPMWLAAVGTVGTLFVSLWLLRRAADDRRIEQARLVAAWSADMSPHADGYALTYLVRNHSDEPVYDVILSAMCGVRGTFVRHLGSLGPDEKREVKILLPGYPRATEYSPSIGFVDSAGRRWVRDGRGRLAKAGPKDIEDLTREDAGAYPSVEDHPTLHLDRPGFEYRGHRVE